MDYYNSIDPNDRSAKRIALVITILLLLLLVFIFSRVIFHVQSIQKEVPPLELIIEEFVEEPEPPVLEQEAPTDVRYEDEVAHVDEASFEQNNQTEGAEPETQAINTNALFKPVVGNVEELGEEGNRLASLGDRESDHGEMGGYNLRGHDQLDAGLQGRGLREGLPKPRTSFNMTGRVVVNVNVDSEGNVISAAVEQRGTTTSDASLHDLAIEAALKAKFKSSDRMIQSGSITYDFKIK
ncbi:MAG: energy transducer TonB [Alistipes sp.]|nr:energy transducer TonB [Alistipes sp.]